MRKRERHQLIKKMITEEKLGTQKEIQDRLEARNVYVTQTTLSRDLREIGLTKVKKNDMVYYVLAGYNGFTLYYSIKSEQVRILKTECELVRLFLCL